MRMKSVGIMTPNRSFPRSAPAPIPFVACPWVLFPLPNASSLVPEHTLLVSCSGMEQVTIGILGRMKMLGDYKLAEREEDTAQVKPSFGRGFGRREGRVKNASVIFYPLTWCHTPRLACVRVIWVSVRGLRVCA